MKDDKIPALGMGVTQIGYSDRHPWEVVKIVSDKTIHVREMKSTKDPEWKPDMIPGGFSAHCVNNNEQKWILKSDPHGRVFGLRKCVDGNWKHKGQKFSIGTAKRFYDYNF